MKYQKLIKRKIRDRTIITIAKYVLLKRFHHDHFLQVYVYDFMYIDPKTMSVEENFPAAKQFVENNNKMSTPGPVPIHWLGFSYICSGDYELNHKFDKPELKKIRPHIQR